MAPACPHNLPPALTSFVGRREELADVTSRIAAHRLVTLTGSGGCGKTRLALAAATASAGAGAFADGVWWVELAPLDDPDLVGPAIAATLGLSDQSGGPMADVLADRLRWERTLLVLDNCEHLVEGCANLVHELLRNCSGLHVLATSRCVLEVAGEHVWPVPPLRVGSDSGSSNGGPLASEAVQLFLERASSSSAAFVVDHDVARQMWEVCQRLDGIPLAIELAAVRVRSLSVSQIAERLDDSLALLTHGAVGSVPHHKTMRATIQWSYDLLDAHQQALLRRLSAFSSGFTLRAAEAVCCDSQDAAGVVLLPSGSVLDTLSELADRSLIVVEQGPAGRARYRMLETIRQYCAGLLAGDDDADDIGSRHLDFYVGLATEAEQHLLGPEMSEWLDALEAELGNVRVALAWASTSPQRAERGLALASLLWRFWLVRGHVREGRRHLERLLGVAGAVPERELGRAHNASGVMALFLGDVGPAAAHFARAQVLFEQTGDDRLAALMLGNVAMCSSRQCHYDSARDLYERSMVALRRLGDDRGVANAACNLGLTLLHQGDLAGAQSYYEESMSIMRRIGDDWSVAGLRMNLAEVAAHRGQYDEAEQLLEQSLASFRTLEDERLVAQVTCDLAQVTLLKGDPSRSIALLEQSLETTRKLGDKEQAALCLMRLGRTTRQRGQLSRAAANYQDCAVLLQRLGNVRMSCELEMEAAMLGAHWSRTPELLADPDLAAIAAAHGERAARLFGAAGLLARTYGIAMPPYVRREGEDSMDRLRGLLGDQGYDAARRDGEALSVGEALSLASSESAAVELARLEEQLRKQSATPLQALREAFGGLTTREREVAALLVRGLTNSEIADELTVAPKTVERHVGNILSKLGFENRAQVAAWAVDKGLAEAPEDLDTLMREDRP